MNLGGVNYIFQNRHVELTKKPAPFRVKKVDDLRVREQEKEEKGTAPKKYSVSKIVLTFHCVRRPTYINVLFK